MTALLVAIHGPSEKTLHILLRATARTSLLFFLSAFTASSLAKRFRIPLTRWLLVNRRYLGVSFAASHAIHLVIVITLLAVSTEWPQAFVLVAAGIGYGFLAAMTATSFDRTAAWLGPRAWKRLHTTGLYYLWFIFVFTYSGTVRKDPLAALSLAVLVAALLLRLTTPRARTGSS